MRKKLHKVGLHIGRVTWHVGRWTWYASAGILALLAVLFTLARLLLPALAEKKPELEEYLSSKSAHQVRIEHLATYWDRLSPGLHVRGLQIYPKDSLRPAIHLKEMRISLSLLPLLWGDVVINRLVVTQPSLAMERLVDGSFRIGGIDPIRDIDRDREKTAAGDQFVSWLFKQNKLMIQDGALQWFDHRDPKAVLHLSRVNLELKNRGDRHRLGFTADFPRGVCDDCSLVLDVTGNPLVADDWEGDAYLRAEEVNINALPLIAREKLPTAFKGKFNLELWTKWKAARPYSIYGRAAVSNLSLPVPKLDVPLKLRQASADLEWEAWGKGWRLDLGELSLGFTRPSWKAGRLRLVHRPNESAVQIGHLDLADITGFITGIKKEHALLDISSELQAGGTVDNMKLLIKGPLEAPKNFTFEADTQNLKVRPYKKFPGVRGVSGHLAMNKDSGKFRLKTDEAAFELPRVFRAPIEARRVSGNVQWKKIADQWEVSSSDLQILAADGEGTGKLLLRVPTDRSISPVLKLRVDFKDGKGRHAKRYFPIRHLRPETLAWMERSFVDGWITRGHLIYEGPIREFPFREGQGRFEIRGHVKDAVYDYLPGWTPITQAVVDVVVDRQDIVVTGTGNIGTLSLHQVVVQTRGSLDDKDRGVRVSGKLDGPINEALRILQTAKPERDIGKWVRNIPANLRGRGNGALSLNLSIPLPHPKSVDIEGEYRFLEGGLKLANTKLELKNLTGSMYFDQHGIHHGGVNGQFLGGEAGLTAERKSGRLQLNAEGKITGPGVARLLGARFAGRLTGDSDWRATWHEGKGMGDLSVEADLQKIKSSLPIPLKRPRGIVDQPLLIRSKSSPGRIQLLTLSVRDQVRGQLAFTQKKDGWRFDRGRIAFGEVKAAMPKRAGMSFFANINAIDIDQWFPLFQNGHEETPDWVTGVSARVASFDMLDRKFGKLYVNLTRSKTGWDGSINGAAVAGQGRIVTKGAGTKIYLDLSRLNLPDKKHAGQDTDVDPRKLPTLGVRSRAFQALGKQLGELDFLGAPMREGWQITRLNLSRPEMKLNISGEWRILDGKHESAFDSTFRSEDMGITMGALELPDQVSKGKVELKSSLTWAGSPANPKLARLDGRLEIAAENGRFLQVEPGAGRLFGLLDLSSIGRYLLLDFSPLFGKGFIFDKIEGHVDIEHGNAKTRDLTIKGPGAKLAVVGRVGLAAEDFDLLLEVQPSLSGSLTLASWGVWGPQVAAAVLAIQKIFKKQIKKGTQVTYKVKGSWKNPEVTKLVKQGKPEKPATSETVGE